LGIFSIEFYKFSQKTTKKERKISKMKIAGIISEYNPFHNGHKYLVDKAKSDGCAVVAVMSGNYTQRGEIAICDKLARAEAAVKCGVDLVLELPFPYAMSSAEFFARGGVSVLERIGADAIYFGSECGDLDFIRRAAIAAASDEMSRLKASNEPNEGSAKGYFDALGKLLGKDVELLSNDILAIEYVKEINRRGLSSDVNAVKRLGDRYRDETASSYFASATAVRGLINSRDTDSAKDYMPAETFETLEKYVKEEKAPVNIENAEIALLSYWRTVDPEVLGEIAELGNGLEYRIKEAALASASLGELEERVATKKYTFAKIRRALLFGFLGVTKETLDSEPRYTAVLAANQTGREILSLIRKSEGDMEIVTKFADAPKCVQSRLSERADALYTLAMPRIREAGYFTKCKIYLE
jgi:predicted nucleotidyltransferase